MSLTVTGPGGSDTETLYDHITVIDPNALPSAGFGVSATSGSAPLSVNFFDSSTGGTIDTYEWDFDADGIVDSTDQFPSYTYVTPGSYDATLTVSGPGGTDSAVQTINVTEPSPPGHDNFVDALIIPGHTYSILSTNVDATREANEPDHGGYSGSRSVWWQWTATTSEEITIYVNQLVGSNPFTNFKIGVYTGDSVDNLTEVPFNGYFSTISFTPIQGTTYSIAVDDASGESGEFSFNLHLYSSLTNDDYIDAEWLTENSGPVFAHNIGATVETSEPDHFGGYYGVMPASVWWRWTAVSSDPVAFNVTDASFPYCVGVYTGESIDTLTWITGGFGPANFIPIPGETYYFAVANNTYTAFGVGTFNVWLSQHPAPQNDDFIHAISLTPGSVSGHNVGSTMETGEIFEYDIFDSNGGCSSVWYYWDSTSTRPVSIEFNEKNFDTLLAVFAGDAIDSLSLVASDISRVEFTPMQGESYYIVVNGENCDQGDFTLNATVNSNPIFPWNVFIPAIIKKIR